MTNLEEILDYNRAFVTNKEYEPYETTKFPNKKMVILSCMDARLTELLEKAMNIKNGDVKMLKNAGAVILSPYDSIVRSILVSIYEFDAREVLIIGHHSCGMSTIDPDAVLNKMINRGISKETISTIENSQINLHDWLKGFSTPQDSVRENVEKIRNHPLVPKDVVVHGLVVDPKTGELELVVNGYEQDVSEK